MDSMYKYLSKSTKHTSFELYTLLDCYLLDDYRDIIVDYGLQWYDSNMVIMKGPTHPPELVLYKDM